MLAAVRSWWKPSPLATSGDLCRFVAIRTTRLSQKSTVDYCRARAGLHWVKLFHEDAFVGALNRCRAIAHDVLLVRVAVMVEAKLRPHLRTAAQQPVLATALTAVARTAQAGWQPAAVPAGGCDAAIARVGRALRDAQQAPPRPAHLIARDAAPPIFDALPIHPTLRQHDFGLIESNISFNLARAAADFECQALPEALIADLVAAADAACPALTGPAAHTTTSALS